MNDDNNNQPNPWMRSIGIWMAILLTLGLLVSLMDNSTRDRESNGIAYSEFLSRVDEGSVKEVVIAGDVISGTSTNGDKFKVYAVSDPALTDRLTAKDVRFLGKPEEGPSIWMVLLYQSLPFILILAVGFFIMRQMQKGAGSGAMGFGKSRAKLLTEKQGRVTFEDVAGIDEAREELEEIVEFLKDPGKFSKLGGKIPKGALLVGSPGTGKTLLARAIAGEANVPFFTISGSDFVEMFVGVGASRVRDMFDQAKRSAPCIVFIDEIDAVGRHRGSGLGNSNDEREQTLNQLLVEMDGFDANEGIIIVAATNRPDVLDPALLRPGRFDRQVVVPLPDVEGREKILGVHMKKVPLAPDVNARTIARGTPGFSGADLANLVNEAALLAARLGKRLVSMAQFEAAKDKVMMGAERRSMVMTEDEKKMTAFHEAGHALIAMLEKAADPIHKATIIPRGRALGMVMQLPERDRYSYHRDQMHAQLAIMMGGRVAEELVFGHEKVSSGASSDIQQASRLARAMVTQWGMSEELGPIQYEEQEDGYLNYGYSQRKPMSAETAKKIDAEIRKLVDGGYNKAKTVLRRNIRKLNLLAEALLEFETLSGEEIQALLKDGTRPDRPDSGSPAAAAVRAAGSSVPKTRKRGGAVGPAPQGA